MTARAPVETNQVKTLRKLSEDEAVANSADSFPRFPVLQVTDEKVVGSPFFAGLGCQRS